MSKLDKTNPIHKLEKKVSLKEKYFAVSIMCSQLWYIIVSIFTYNMRPLHYFQTYVHYLSKDFKKQINQFLWQARSQDSFRRSLSLRYLWLAFAPTSGIISEFLFVLFTNDLVKSISNTCLLSDDLKLMCSLALRYEPSH